MHSNIARMSHFPLQIVRVELRIGQLLTVQALARASFRSESEQLRTMLRLHLDTIELPPLGPSLYDWHDMTAVRRGWVRRVEGNAPVHAFAVLDAGDVARLDRWTRRAHYSGWGYTAGCGVGSYLRTLFLHHGSVQPRAVASGTVTVHAGARSTGEP